MILEVENLVSGYPTRRIVLRSASLHVDEQEIVVIMGHNGAGKTTLLNTVFGLLRVHSGKILYDGKKLGSVASRVKAGMSYCPQGQGTFPTMSVMENLDLAVLSLSIDTKRYRERLETVFELFPILEKRKRQRAGTLSGGEQRMLSVGMALMQHPRLLLLDEPSLGLSPKLIEELFDVVRKLTSSLGMSILLVEQNVKHVVGLTNRIYILKMGEVIFSGDPKILLDNEELWKRL